MERKNRDLCIKSKDQKVLVKDIYIKEGRENFNKLLNGDFIGSTRTREDTSLTRHTLYRRIRLVEVKKTLTRKVLLDND